MWGGGRCCSRVGTTRGGSGWPRRRRRRRRLSWTKSILWPPIPRHPFASSLTRHPLPTNPPCPLAPSATLPPSLPPRSPFPVPLAPSDSIRPSKAALRGKSEEEEEETGGGGRRVVWAGCRCRVITTLKTRVALAHPTTPARRRYPTGTPVCRRCRRGCSRWWVSSSLAGDTRWESLY